MRLPHARGGVSRDYAGARRQRRSSPRPWGCFCAADHTSAPSTVFPTPVGVFPSQKACLVVSRRLPHARGGVSGAFTVWKKGGQVFPTPVGVFLMTVRLKSLDGSLPHARGGVSLSAIPHSRCSRSSPRPWGCFPLHSVEPLLPIVFPTPVGVFLQRRGQHRIAEGLPHARGGVSAAMSAKPFS